MISLGNQNIGIGLAVRLHDHFSVKAAAITATMSAMHRNTQAVMMSNLRAVRGLALGFGIAGAVMTAGFAQTIKIAADFGWIMRGTQAVTQATDIQMKSMARSAIELSKGTVYAATEIGSAMEYLGRAGYTVPQINQTIEAVTMLGAATDAAIGGKGGVADMMTNMMTAFNMTAKASGRMSDILAYSTTRANIDVFDLHEALKFAGSSATQLKIPFEDVVAMVTVLGNAGIKAGIAGRSLGNVFQYMARAASTFRTKSQTDVLKILGIHPTQLRTIEGTLRPMGEIITLFTKALKGVYDVEGTAGLQKLLNIRGARAFYPLTRAVSLGWDFNTMLKNIHTNSQGAATMMAKMRMDSLKGDMIILKDIWKAFKIEVGQTLEPFVRIVLKGLQKTMLAMTAFAKTPLGKVFFTLTSIIGITVGVAGLLLAGLISIRLITIGVGITGANMGRSLVWAWNSAAAAAARYAMVAQGASWVGAGGVFAKKGMRGFQKYVAPGVIGGTGFFGVIWQFIKAIPKFLGSLLSSISGLSMFGGLIRIITGPIGLIVTGLGAIMGFNSLMKLAVVALGSFVQRIAWLLEIIWGIGKNFGSPWTWGNVIKQADETYHRRKAIMRGNLGLSSGGGGEGRAHGYYSRNIIGWEDIYKNMANEQAGRDSIQQANVELRMDSSKVGEAVIKWETFEIVKDKKLNR